MKTYTTTYAGFGVAGLIILISIAQWQVWNNDMSQFLFGIGFGVSVLAFSLIYNSLRSNNEEHNAELKVISRQMDQFLSWKLKMEGGK